MNRIQASRAPRSLFEDDASVYVVPEMPAPEPELSQWEKTANAWLANYRWGREFTEMAEFLSEEKLDLVSEMLRDKAYELFQSGAVSNSDSLESAYISLLDAGDLEPFYLEWEYNRTHPPVIVATGFHGETKVLRDLTPEQLAKQKSVMADCQRLEDERQEQIRLDEYRSQRELGRTKAGLQELRRKAIPVLRPERVNEIKSKIYLG